MGNEYIIAEKSSLTEIADGLREKLGTIELMTFTELKIMR